MKTRHAHPNEPGVWTLLDHADAVALWRRERIDPVPVTLFYIVRPAQQDEILYSEERAREAFTRFTAGAAGAARSHEPQC